MAALRHAFKTAQCGIPSETPEPIIAASLTCSFNFFKNVARNTLVANGTQTEAWGGMLVACA